MSKPGYSCGWRRQQVIEALHTEEGVVSGKYEVDVSFKEVSGHGRYDKVGQGMTDGIPDGNVVVTLGMRGLSSPDWPFVPVSDLSFVKLMNCLSHEDRHFAQAFDLAQQPDETGFYMACSLTARRNNDTFFHQNEHAFFCEYEARRQALIDTVGWFSERFGKSVAESVVLDSLNVGALGRAVMPAAPGRNIRSLDEAYWLFDMGLKDVMQDSKHYDKGGPSCDDEVALALHLFDGDASWGYFRDRFNHAVNGLQQESMIAATHLYLHPEFKQHFKVFGEFDVSPEDIFGRAFPESRESMLQRMPAKYLSEVDREFLGKVECVSKPVEPVVHRRNSDDLDAAYNNIMQAGRSVDDGHGFDR